MKKSSWLRPLLLATSLMVLILLLSTLYLQPTRTVRSKAPAAPLSDELSPEQKLAQDLALSDARVQALTVGRRSEVFGVSLVGQHFPASAAACATADCRQVQIYNFDENVTVTAIVNVDSQEVLEVFRQPELHPGINKRLVDLAVDLAVNDPTVIDVLGFRPRLEDIDMAPVDADAPGTSCDGSHLCVAPTFTLEDRVLWVLVDLTEEKVAGLRWTSIIPEDPIFEPFTPTACPPSGSVNRDGWAMNHEVTSSDGLRAFDVTFNGREVLTSVKLAEWHADYGSTGFRDSTGCGGGSGGFPINPYENTKVLDLLDDQSNIIGFELVQDFRMGAWGASCNYRYEQHYQFFQDGRFRIVGGAYGKGCGVNALYRPLVRIDIAVDGDDNDTFGLWDGSQWVDQATELWRTPYEGEYGPHAMTPGPYAWRVLDQSGSGYYIEPGVGQFDDGGRGDDPFIYAVLHKPGEGDSDLATFPDCCNDDHRQGPHIYVNGETITNTNIVLWYVPQSLTDAVAGNDGYYCWTLQGEPNPVTYPCFSGPMFIPAESEVLPTAAFTHNSPVNMGQTAVFSNTSAGSQPMASFWDFGDGISTTTGLTATHSYIIPGIYTVTLTTTNAFGRTDTTTSLFEVLVSWLNYLPFFSEAEAIGNGP